MTEPPEELLSDEELQDWRDEMKAHYASGFTKIGDRIKRQLRAYEAAIARKS